jgi:hypothetical protein
MVHVKGYGKDIVPFVKTFLGTISVMNVPVDDSHPRNSRSYGEVGSESTIVDKTVAISLCRCSVMTTRSDQRVSQPLFSFEYVPHRFQRGSGRRSEGVKRTRSH